MFLRRLLLVAFSAASLSASPALAEGGTLMKVLFPTKTEKVEEKAPKKQKLSAKEKAKQKKLAAEKAEKKRKLAAAEAEEPAPKKRSGGLLPGVFAGEDGGAAVDVVASGNNGELRSEAVQRKPGLFAGLFGGEQRQRMLPETEALDAVMAQRDARKKFQVKSDFVPQEVDFSGYDRGTIVIDTKARFLYLVQSASTARRYAIAVGKDGLQFKGNVTVGDKQEWPRWIPTVEMQKREPKKYGPYKDGMPGGPDNPLGARAIYLYQGNKDTHLRIHGTNQPQSIGSASSNGCFRMVNEHVMDLYGRVRKGTQVIVM